MRAVCKTLFNLGLWAAATASCAADAPCEQPVYLTFDTGHMGVAPFIAEVLARQQIYATFFLANEPTRTGGTSLDENWTPWWKKMAEAGHAFGSHTFDHAYWQGDTADGRFLIRPSAGPQAGKKFIWTGAQYCEELDRSARRFEKMTDQKILPLFRAAGGKTSPALLRAAQACGYEHVGWAPAGFLGDELPSEQYPNSALLEQALRGIRIGDILVAHLGIWSRKDPWAPAVLEPLIVGLKQRGFCFATLEWHPAYREKILAAQSSISAGERVAQPPKTESPTAAPTGPTTEPKVLNDEAKEAKAEAQAPNEEVKEVNAEPKAVNEGAKDTNVAPKAVKEDAKVTNVEAKDANATND